MKLRILLLAFLLVIVFCNESFADEVIVPNGKYYEGNIPLGYKGCKRYVFTLDKTTYIELHFISYIKFSALVKLFDSDEMPIKEFNKMLRYENGPYDKNVFRQSCLLNPGTYYFCVYRNGGPSRQEYDVGKYRFKISIKKEDEPEIIKPVSESGLIDNSDNSDNIQSKQNLSEEETKNNAQIINNNGDGNVIVSNKDTNISEMTNIEPNINNGYTSIEVSKNKQSEEKVNNYFEKNKIVIKIIIVATISVALSIYCLVKKRQLFRS